MTTKNNGRVYAYIGAVSGGAVSVAANIAHSFIAPDGAPADWKPEPGAVISAIVWPLFLFIAIEILARTPWPTGWGWNVLRWVGLPPVALVAAFVSYRHLSGLLDHYNEETLVVWFGPLAVDGLMLMATTALLATGKRTTRPTDPVPALVPATTVEASSSDIPASPLVRPAAATPATNPAPDTVPAPVHEPINLPTSSEDTELAPTVEHTPDTTADTDTTPAPAAPVTAALPPALLSNARLVATAHAKTHGEPISPGQLAVRLRVPTATAADILTALNNQPTTNNKTHNGTAVGAIA
ncbi:hypothetical protein ACGF7U_12640 [Micromonospora sp. NPDC047670]|uniref:hypothetical protein n=1 Tax=Micromonospora sp. NPDC047670 TaxID=3364252 RepID=UPI00372099EF